MTYVMPALFIAHGAPMNVVDDNVWTRNWAAAVAGLPTPKAVLSVSAHWQTRGVAVNAEAAPRTMDEYAGFPKAIAEMTYPAAGSPELAGRVAELLAPTPVRLAQDRGLDHGAWSVVIHMYPKADVPLIQLSLDRNLTAQEHYDLAGRLSPLREEGVLIVASGGIVHNQRAEFFRRLDPADWAVRFRDAVNALIAVADHGPLIHYQQLGLDAILAVNSEEHYLPLLYVLALQRPGEAISIFNDDIFASISMTSIRLG